MDDKKGGLTTVAPWLALIIAVVSAGYSLGVQDNRIGNLESQVVDMRTENRSNAVALAEIKETTTIIRTKLEILLPTGNIKDGARR